MEVILPFFFLSVKVILKLESPSEKPANQALLFIGDKSKPKGSIVVPLELLNHSIDRCNASILGVRMKPLIILTIFITSFIFRICHIAQPSFFLMYNLPSPVIEINFSAKGISFKLNTINILGVYLLALEFLSCTANEPSASINPAK